jgi:spore germination cell wall hydrolase CwlJ-like protein
MGAAAIAAALGLTFATAELSGAVAQDSDTNTEISTTIASPSSDPVFIAEEIVQPLADTDSQDSDATDAVAARPAAASLRELVSKTDKNFSLSEEMQCLAGAVYFEARGEPLAGQLAVAQVVINRADSLRFPSSYCGVVYQRAQFSFVKGGNMPRIRTKSDAWKRAKAIARIAHEGHWDSEAQDSLYFHAKYVKPSWSRKKTRLATIDTHIFYR